MLKEILTRPLKILFAFVFLIVGLIVIHAKYIIIGIGAYLVYSLVFSPQANAYDVPKDAVIKVFTKDGKQIGEMSRSEYKVVKIGTSKDFTVEETNMLITHHVNEYRETRKNRVTLKAGTGYYDMKHSYSNNVNTMAQRRDFLLGIGYSRMLTDEFSLGVSIHTNETFTVDGGVDF